MDDDHIEELPSKKLTDRDKYYLEQGYKEPVERIGRIEEVAKFLAGATATTSGLYLAAYKIALGQQTVTALVWFLPYLLWAASLILFVLVLLPNKYPTYENNAESWRRAFLRCGKCKYWRLMAGAVFFILGILAGTWSFRYLP